MLTRCSFHLMLCDVSTITVNTFEDLSSRYFNSKRDNMAISHLIYPKKMNILQNSRIIYESILINFLILIGNVYQNV